MESYELSEAFLCHRLLYILKLKMKSGFSRQMVQKVCFLFYLKNIGRGFMSEGRFYAYLSRMKYINRWALMRNSMEENLCEHTLETAYIAHALGLISNRRCGGSV